MMEVIKRKPAIFFIFFIAAIIFLWFKNDILSGANKSNLKHATPISEVKKVKDSISGEAVALEHPSLPAKNTNVLSLSAASHESLQHRSSTELDFTKYSNQLPKLFVLHDMYRPNVNYALPVDADEVHIAYYKKLMDEGDSLAKFLYASRISIPLTRELNEDFNLKGENIDIDYWRKRFEQVHKLYIESAVSGIDLATAQLASSPNHIFRIDKLESLSWALIADQMGENDNRYVKIICREVGGCADEVLQDGVNRAKLYLDLYEFKQK
jgi:hypothetical protein